MSDNDNFDTSAGNRVATAPYNAHHPVPTVQRYEEIQQHRQDLDQSKGQDVNINGSSHGSVKSYLHLNGESKNTAPELNGAREPYNSQNRNTTIDEADGGVSSDSRDGAHPPETQSKTSGHGPSETQQKVAEETDPRKKRKSFKHLKRDNQGRKVTDPVTHLQVTIHDSTDKELENVPENPLPSGSDPRTATGPSGASKSESQLRKEEDAIEAEHKGMQRLFPPPNLQATKEQIASTYNRAITVGLSLITITSFMTILLSHILSHGGQRSWTNTIVTSGIIPFVGLVVGGAILWGLRDWLAHKVDEIWDDEIWEASKTHEDQQRDDSTTPESVQWLNSLLASVWPLINPDLFTSLADTLEDVMQASLPKLVRMVSVDDLGQGSETIRILGIKWLPTGAAANSVSVDGKIKPGNNKDSDRKAPGQGQIAENTNPDEPETSNEEGKSQNNENIQKIKEEESDKENIAEGMEAEEGDFVNIEVAFSYRATSSGKELKKKVKNAHLFLEFYLPGGIKFREYSAHAHLHIPYCVDVANGT